MSNDQEEHQYQQPQSPSELRQSILAEFEAVKQSITDLSDEQLEEIAGGGLFAGVKGVYDYYRQYKNASVIKSVGAALKQGSSAAKAAATYGDTAGAVTRHMYDLQHIKAVAPRSDA